MVAWEGYALGLAARSSTSLVSMRFRLMGLGLRLGLSETSKA